MNRTTFAVGLCLFFALLGLVGCNSKVRYDGAFKLEPGGARTLEVDAPKDDQKVNIEVSSGEAVSMVVATKSKELARRSGQVKISEAVDVPAGQKFTIKISLDGSKPTDVTVKARSVD
jgi:hypothetical protein